MIRKVSIRLLLVDMDLTSLLVKPWVQLVSLLQPLITTKAISTELARRFPKSVHNMGDTLALGFNMNQEH